MMAVAGHACFLPIGFSLSISPARHKRTGQSHAVHTDTQSFDTRRSLDAWMRTTHPLVVECCTVVHYTCGGSHSCGSHRWGISNHAASPPRWGNHKKCMSPSLRNCGCRTWQIQSLGWTGKFKGPQLDIQRLAITTLPEPLFHSLVLLVVVEALVCRLIVIFLVLLSLPNGLDTWMPGR